MISPRINPAPVCPNPSRKRDEYGCDHGVGPYQNGKSVRNVSNLGVTDFRGCKSIYSKYIYLSSIYTSRCHAHARALRVRTREGVCDVFEGRIHFPRPAQHNPIGPRSRTFAPCGECSVVAPTFPSRHTTQHVATRWPTCDLPLWQANRYFGDRSPSSWPAGTAPVLGTVCFACPVLRNAKCSNKLRSFLGCPVSGGGCEKMSDAQQDRNRDTTVHQRLPSSVSQCIDWYAEGEERVVEAGGIRIVIRFVGRKGRRGRIAITAPPGATFLACDRTQTLQSPECLV